MVRIALSCRYILKVQVKKKKNENSKILIKDLRQKTYETFAISFLVLEIMYKNCAALSNSKKSKVNV